MPENNEKVTAGGNLVVFVTMLISLLLFCLSIPCEGIILFENASLSISTTTNNYNQNLYVLQPISFNIIFRTIRPIYPYETISISLPRFTRRLSLNSSEYNDYDLTTGNVRLSPSTVFEGAWINGQLNSSDSNSSLPYSQSQLILRSRFSYLGSNIQNDSLYNVTVYLANRIGIYCGFPSSEEYYLSQYRVSVSPFTISNNNVTNSTQTIKSFDGFGLGCTNLNNCNGHGACDYCYNKCICQRGFGSIDDIITNGKDVEGSCSSRVCPVGKALTGSLLTTRSSLAECSNVGVCNRISGTCKCYPPYEGTACERIGCANNCSGHGRCMSMSDLSKYYSLDGHYSYEYGTASSIFSKAWDYDVLYGCACDSSWRVGYGANETQLPEYFGADCSLKHCPSGDNPFTPKDEENCHDVSQAGAPGGFTGLVNNRCHIDCANRGICDYSSGTCKCFDGSYGDNCALVPNNGTRTVYKTVDLYS